MKLAGLSIYLLSNLFLGYTYLLEIIKYYNGVYNYDGFRYLIPMIIGDLGFLISTILLLFYFGIRHKYFYILVLFVIFHNVILGGVNVKYTPFCGFVLAFMSVVFIIAGTIFRWFSPCKKGTNINQSPDEGKK